MKKIILEKSFTREFPLIQVQLWGRRYTKEFLGVRIPLVPFYIFRYDNGMVTAFRNVSGQFNIINKIIQSKIKVDKNFIVNFVNSKNKDLKFLIKFIRKKKINITEFDIYLGKLFECWQLHYIAQFVPLDQIRFSLRNRKLALQLRSTIDQIIVNSWSFIKSGLLRLYPSYGGLVDYITYDEIQSKQVPGKKELIQRKKVGLTLFNDRIVGKKVLKNIIKKYNLSLIGDSGDSKVTSERTAVKGQIAMPGVVRGRVKKIFRAKEVGEFQKGKILITYMTMPSFLPAMKRASAFVTDEGGITCHAAIIARELKKPCIIGTKIATKVFKDGDLVEVDANKGVVRKI